MYLSEAERTNKVIYDDFKLKKNFGLLIYIKIYFRTLKVKDKILKHLNLKWKRNQI